jgi:hypothetical protein
MRPTCVSQSLLKYRDKECQAAKESGGNTATYSTSSELFDVVVLVKSSKLLTVSLYLIFLRYASFLKILTNQDKIKTLLVCTHK